MLDGFDFKEQLTRADIVADSRRRLMTELLRLASDPRFKNTPDEIDRISKTFSHHPLSIDPQTNQPYLNGYKIPADELQAMIRHAQKLAGFGDYDGSRDWGRVYEFVELPRVDRMLFLMRLSDTAMVAAAVWMCVRLDCPVPLHLVYYLGLPPYVDSCVYPLEDVTYLSFRPSYGKVFSFAWPSVLVPTVELGTGDPRARARRRPPSEVTS